MSANPIPSTSASARRQQQQQQQSETPTIIFIRPYNEDTDKQQVSDLVYEGTMDPVHRFFRRALFSEILFQAMIMTASLLFIIVGLHFYTTILVSIPFVIVLAYVSIWIAHFYKAKYLHPDMSNIPKNYMTNSTTFFVAEAFYHSIPDANKSSSSCAFVTSQAEFDHYNHGQAGLITNSSRSRAIIGTVGVVRDRDHVLTAWIRRMTVSKAWRRCHVGSALVDAVLKFCSNKGFITIDLITTECHDSARKLYECKGFEMKQFYHKKIFGMSSLAITMYFMSLELKNNTRSGRSVLES